MGVSAMDEVLYEVLYGVMCGWNGCDVDVDDNSKEKINPFLPDLGRDGLRMREGAATSLVSDNKECTCKERQELT